MNGIITENPFGVFEDKPVTEYTLANENGMQVSVINYGATITKIISPDRHGAKANVIIGFDSMEGYFQNSDQYIGCIVGRYCNRIADARFSIDGTSYTLATNNQGNSLHGGIKGFDKAWWHIEKNEADCSLKLTYQSKDGEEGFPGNLHVEVIYRLYPDNALMIDYSAVTDKATHVNLTSHCYFNLSGGKLNNVLDHELLLFAEKFTVANESSIPTGELAFVKNTPYDFTSPKKVGTDIGSLPNGYDMNMVLNGDSGKAAVLYEPTSGRSMEVFTTEPGLQFYSGNFLNIASDDPADESKYQRHAALCLEAQHFPNSPNESSFPSTMLMPGCTYRQTTIYKFSVI
ncbi:galactose mutarotase [soil metagenome]